MTVNVTNVVRKAPVTHKDLSLAYMLNGLSAVGQALKDHTDPVKVLNKTIENLSAGGQDVEELETLRDTFAASTSNGVRGRKAAKVGEVRPFSVQQITNDKGEAGDVFIRLPLSTLGVLKGAKVYASFTKDGIETSAKA